MKTSQEPKWVQRSRGQRLVDRLVRVVLCPDWLQSSSFYSCLIVLQVYSVVTDVYFLSSSHRLWPEEEMLPRLCIMPVSSARGRDVKAKRQEKQWLLHTERLIKELFPMPGMSSPLTLVSPGIRISRFLGSGPLKVPLH